MKTALVAIGRRENQYAREWVEHYLKLGFDHIFICDNNRYLEEHFEAVIGDYVDDGLVTILDYRKTSGYQSAAYNEVYRKYGSEYDWIAFFDFDEFLTFGSGYTLKKMLGKCAGYDCVLVNWECYGDNGLVHNDMRKVQERFTEPLPMDLYVQYTGHTENEHCKSIVRGGLGEICFKSNPHLPDTRLRCCTADGKRCEHTVFQQVDFTVARLKHYITKTVEEYMVRKWSVGTGNKPTLEIFRNKYNERFYKYNQWTTEKAFVELKAINSVEQNINVCVVNYNTSELTTAAILSLNRCTPGCHVIVIDNSDKEPFTMGDVPLLCNVEVINNTQGQIINFDEWLEEFPDKHPGTGNNWASAKHCYTVQWVINKRRNPMILMDSDILVKRDISPLWDNRYVYAGQRAPHHSRFGDVDRVLPFLCYLNIPAMKRAGISYYNSEKMFCLNQRRPDMAYDTGCWFLEDCVQHRAPHQNLNLDDYILHLGHGSWRDMKWADWLEMHSKLWKP